MTYVLILVLIVLTFGFIFAKLDTLGKNCKILKDEITNLQKDFEVLKSKDSN